MLPRRLVRPVLVALGVLLVSTGAVVTLVPFESWVCTQLVVDVGWRWFDPRVSNATVWECLRGAWTLRTRYEDEQAASLAERERRLRLEAAQRPEAAPPVVPKDEPDRPLRALARATLCPRVAAMNAGPHALWLRDTQEEGLLFSLTTPCPECRFIAPPEYLVERADGSIFCRGGGVSGDQCTTAVQRLTARGETRHAGSGGELARWLGCP